MTTGRPKPINYDSIPSPTFCPATSSQAVASRTSRCHGQPVAAPGVYQLLSGETLPQLLARAGGLTPNA